MLAIHLGEHVLKCIAICFQLSSVHFEFTSTIAFYGSDMQILAIYHVVKVTNSNNIQPGTGHKH